MASLENFISHLGTCPPGNFCKLARCTEIEFCVNFDHKTHQLTSCPTLIHLKELIQMIHYHDFLLHWYCCYSSSLSYLAYY